MDATDRWPALPYAGWEPTFATLHMWTQVVGKIALAHGPRLNHCWGIALQITPTGLVTRPLTHGARTFAIEFDLLAHELWIRTADGDARMLPLTPRPVAELYRLLLETLAGMHLPVRIWPMPVEVPSPIRFDADTVHASYDAEAVSRFWRVVVAVERVLTEARCAFIGKASPAHFFWGSFDLALTRFSGRPAPPREGPAFMREAYSHEVISHGFWPGGPSLPEPIFYAYAVPEPAGLRDARVAPPAAFYHRELGEFVLPYEAVRTAPDPDAALRSFVDSTYAAAATLAHWDRASLERP